MPKKQHKRVRDLPKSFTGFGTVYHRLVNSKEKPKVLVAAGDRFDGKQITVSEGHHWPPDKSRKLRDEGGPFYTTKSYVEYIPNSIVQTRRVFAGEEYFCSAPAIAPIPFSKGYPQFPVDPRLSDSDLDELGTTAIALCKPTNSVAELSTALGEFLKDGLPSLPGISLWRSRTQALLGVADEFLNTVFAWAPLLKDIEETTEAISGMSQVIKQYERDNGRVVRRSFYFPTIREEEETVHSVNAYGRIAADKTGLVVDVSSLGTVMRHRVTTRKQYFKGAFTYHIPTENTSWQNIASGGNFADKLFGTTVNPQTLWELVPWSWAIDWFSNAGDVIANFQDFEIGGLVMRYGYMMEHSIVKDTYTLVGGSGLRTEGLKKKILASDVAPVTLVTESKVRRPANPFGFGLSWDGLSPLQLAILAALGISRSS